MGHPIDVFHKHTLSYSDFHKTFETKLYSQGSCCQKNKTKETTKRGTKEIHEISVKY